MYRAGWAVLAACNHLVGKHNLRGAGFSSLVNAGSIFSRELELEGGHELRFAPFGDGAGDSWHRGAHHRVGKVLGSVAARLLIRDGKAALSAGAPSLMPAVSTCLSG